MIHRASPNAETLRRLYQQADLFVLPTRAECFGIAAVEALASGCPVVMSDIGGARDIVENGRNGWLITPDAVSLTAVLKRAIEQRQCLPAMGLEGRRIAEQRFDGRQNDGLLVDWILELAAHFHDRQMISVREHSS
jgi:glycosyltransferase involved in cell wall biosynthesis